MLTVLIPCRDEQHNIVECIAAARLVADEILVADSESVDATLDLVRREGDCKIIQREFVNYADFKNWAIPQAKHEWVLIVDADERVTPELAAEIKRALADTDDDIDGYFVPRQSFFMGYKIRYCGWQSDRPFRLIRRDRCRYAERRVHEEVAYDIRRTRRLQSKLLHYTYRSYDDFFNKHMKDTYWGALDKWEGGQKTNYFKMLLRPFFRFFYLYAVRRGFLDGIAGLQLCLLIAFFDCFVKQARLWEFEHVRPPQVAPKLTVFDSAELEADIAAQARVRIADEIPRQPASRAA